MRFAIVDELGATRDYADTREDADRLADQGEDLFVVDMYCARAARRRTVDNDSDALRHASATDTTTARS